ncbi:MAG TPA: AAA family ATPase, partial [Streptosporangiaceae bacterium]
MLCPKLIDRGAEQKALAAAVGNASHGTGGLLFLAGEAGVGKSRLAREAVSLATEQGLCVLVGRATESMVRVPFRPITEALMKLARSGVSPDSPQLASYRAALGSLAPVWRRPADDEAEISPVIQAEALLRLLAVAMPQGALLVIEDLHWADPETLAIIEYLADNLADIPVLCVATLRDSEPSAGLDFYRSVTARRIATSLELHRLPASGVRQMAAACLGTDDVPDEVTELLADSDGLPFAVEEILAAASSSGQLVNDAAGWQVRDQVTTRVPASILGSVRNRLAGLGPVVTDVLACAAVLGRQFDWTLLPHMTRLTEPEVLAALRQAQEVQLIDTAAASESSLLRFRHSLTRNAILSDLLPPDLTRRSARAAAAIESAHPGLPGAWCELAAELHAAAGDQERAASLLLEAGRRALRHGALASAAGALRDARKLAAATASDDPALAIDIDEALVIALSLAGNHRELAPVAEQLIARLESAGNNLRRQTRVLLLAARAESELDPAAAAAHLSAARAIAERVRHPITSSWVDAVAARCALDTGNVEGADELAHRALASAEAAGLRGSAADVAFEALQVIGRTERLRDLAAARQAFERAYEIATDEDFVVRRITALHDLGTIDTLIDGSTSRLSEARVLAQRAGAVSTAIVIDLQLAITWSLGTDLDRALEAARQCELGARRFRAQHSEALAINLQAFIAAIRADRDEAEKTAERAERILPGDPEVLFLTWGVTRVTASLFRDDLSRALQESETAMTYRGSAVLLSPRRAWGYYAILQAVSGGDGRGAIERARGAGAAVGWNAGYLAYAEAVLEGRDGHRDRAAALAQEGGVLLAPYAPWWNHLARRLVAPAAFEDGWGRPADWLRQAAAEFEAGGQLRLASACRALLRRAGERVPRSGRGSAQVPPQMRRLGITSREMDVFLLVARGCSNAE